VHRAYNADILARGVCNSLYMVLHYGQAAATGEYVYWGLAYVDDTVSENELRAVFTTQAGDYGYPVRRVAFMEVFDYNYRYTPAAVATGVPARVHAGQGSGGVPRGVALPLERRQYHGTRQGHYTRVRRYGYRVGADQSVDAVPVNGVYRDVYVDVCLVQSSIVTKNRINIDHCLL
jgi:hypothetical protein